MDTQIAAWIPPIVFVIGFVAQTAYFKGVFGTKFIETDRRLDHIESGVMWKDTCEPKHAEINRRLDRLEEA